MTECDLTDAYTQWTNSNNNNNNDTNQNNQGQRKKNVGNAFKMTRIYNFLYGNLLCDKSGSNINFVIKQIG